MSLLKEVSNLKQSDATDAGKTDVVDKLGANDVSFSLIRNTINTDGGVKGSDVSNYLERAAELNDEVDTVLYGLETDDGEVVKVYVNATQAADFEEEMKKMLGVEDDIENAIDTLATKFDIVDVIWPKGSERDEQTKNADGATDADLDLDMGDDMEVVASADDEAPADEAPAEGATDDEAPASDEGDDEAPSDDEAPASDDAADEEAPSDDEAPAEGDDEDGAPTGDEESDSPKKKSKDLKKVGAKLKATESQGVDMTIGKRFLTRVLNEEKEDKDGLQDGMNVPLDGPQRALFMRVKYKLPQKIVSLFAMLGIPGIKLNSEDTERGILEAADMLRQEVSVRRAFNDFYEALGEALGKKIVVEAKIKRGNATQKLLETVLVKLGLPEELVLSTGPAVVGTALFNASKVLEDNADLKMKLRLLATRMGIRPSDVMGTEGEEMKEAQGELRLGANLQANTVEQLVTALGLDKVFNIRDMAAVRGSFNSMSIPAPALATMRRLIQQLQSSKKPAGEQ